LTPEELLEKRARLAAERNGDVEAGHSKTTEGKIAENNGSDSGIAESDIASEQPEKKKSLVGPKPDAPIYSPEFLWWGLKFLFLRGVDKDIIAEQKADKVISGDVEEINSKAPHYDNQTEFLYTFLQIMTASAAAFTHGANDVANAVGPYASIYQIWREGVVPGKKSDVPIWILVFGGAGLAVSTPYLLEYGSSINDGLLTLNTARYLDLLLPHHGQPRQPCHSYVS
jgi:solute carrier family 20 (sodium-dependent phosphate transporter)